MKTTVVAGTDTRGGAGPGAPAQRLGDLRSTLLGGRGPGAPEEEVLAHTRNRSWLGAVPAPVERTLIQRQADDLRAGEPIVRGRTRGAERPWSLGAAFLGAIGAFVGGALADRLLRHGAHHRRTSRDISREPSPPHEGRGRS